VNECSIEQVLTVSLYRAASLWFEMHPRDRRVAGHKRERTMKTKLISLAILMAATFNVFAQDATGEPNTPWKSEPRSAQEWLMPV
jgi:hypothetical protein